MRTLAVHRTESIHLNRVSTVAPGVCEAAIRDRTTVFALDAV
jgi:hypothetical protein